MPGDPYYIDRSYGFTALPMFLQFLNGIKTSNDDCPDPVANDDAWICFEVVEPVRVFILHDNRIVNKPAWLTVSENDEF